MESSSDASEDGNDDRDSDSNSTDQDESDRSDEDESSTLDKDESGTFDEDESDTSDEDELDTFNEDESDKSDEDGELSYVQTIDDVNKKKIKKEMTFYKVNNSELKMHGEFKGNEEDLESKIQDALTTDGDLKYHKLRESKCSTFRVCLFTHEAEIKGSTAVQEQISSQRGAQQTKFKPARRNGCIIAFFRILSPHKPPEIFLLCAGSSYRYILRYVDVDFRTEMIKRNLKDSNIKAYSYLSLTGPDMKTTKELRTNIEDFFKHTDFFGKILTDVKGEIEPNSDLARCIQAKNKAVRIDFGAYKIKFFKRITCQTWAEIMNETSNYTETETEYRSDTQAAIVQAFESVRKVEKKQHGVIEKLFQERVVHVISTNDSNTEMFLGTRSPQHFMQASSFTLQIQEKKGAHFKEVENWRSSPSLQDVIHALHKKENLDQIKRYLDEKKIYFDVAPRRKRPKPIQAYIYGTVDVENVKYHKVGSHWYKLSAKYIHRINREFKRLVENAVEDKDTTETLLGVLKYNWSFQDSFTTNDIGTKVTDILSEDVQLLEAQKFQFYPCENLYLIPKSTQLVVMLTKALTASNDKKTGQKKSKELSKEVTLNYIRKVTENAEISKGDIGILEHIKPKIHVIKEHHNSFKVVNPVISKTQYEKLTGLNLTEDGITDLLSKLRSYMPLSEDEYSELYLHPKHKGFTVIPGDRVFVNDVELFDILIYDENQKVTYLVHNKDGFDKNIRVACSQIRTSAEMFWNDYITGGSTNVSKWWKAATSERTKSQYRKQLKKKVNELGFEKLKTFFEDDKQIVFVLGFRHAKVNFLEQQKSDPKGTRSTIAKLELLSLFSHFAKFQSGGWRKYRLKVLQLKSDHPMEVARKRKSDELSKNAKQKDIRDFLYPSKRSNALLNA